MDRLWKSLMRLDAKALFFGSAILFAVVIGVVAWLRLSHGAANPSQRPFNAALAANAALRMQSLGVLACVSNQLSADAAIVPVCPFRPTIENMIAMDRTDPAFADATNWLARFSHRTNPASRQPNAGDATAPRPHVLTFVGYFQRPDGAYAGLFHDSVDNSSRFFSPDTNAVLSGLSLLSVDKRTARMRLPDGATRELAIGKSVTLQEEKP